MRGLSNDDERGRARIVRERNHFEAAFKAGHAAPVKSEKDAEAVISSLIESSLIESSLIELIGRRNLLAACPAYRQGNWLEKVMKSAGMHLHRSSRDTTSWAEALDVFEVLHAVPLMTIHRAKVSNITRSFSSGSTMEHGGASRKTSMRPRLAGWKAPGLGAVTTAMSNRSQMIRTESLAFTRKLTTAD
jgi:hypothetical protein